MPHREPASEHCRNALQLLAALIVDERIVAHADLFELVRATRDRVKAAQMMTEECATALEGSPLRRTARRIRELLVSQAEDT